MTKHLFIGGESDGMMMLTDERSQYWKIPSWGDGEWSEETYRRESIHSGPEVFEFFVLDSIITQDAIRKLIDGYKDNMAQ